VTAPVAAQLSKRAPEDLDGIALDAAKEAKRLKIASRLAEFDAQQAATQAATAAAARAQRQALLAEDSET
jgi:hypothetical protein